MNSNYYVDGYSWSEGGYVVKSKGQGNCKIAVFVDDGDAVDFARYRNYMLGKYGTSDTRKYKDEL